MIPGIDPSARPRLAAHQIDAVGRLRAILRNHRGAVLADEPGLGKTWVAAAIAAEWPDRVDAIVPAPLRGYWRDVLSKFGVRACVASHESLVDRADRAVEPGLVIVDEAHRFRNPLTKRYEGLAALSVNRRLLLVTATPLCNSPADLLALLRLVVADDELAAIGAPSLADCVTGCGPGAETVIRRLIVRRSAREVDAPMPWLREVTIEYDPAKHAGELWKRIGRLTFPWMDDATRRELPLLVLERRLESSVAAFAATIRRMQRICRRARALATRGVSLTATELRRVLGDPDLPLFQDLLFPELWGARTGLKGIDSGCFDDEWARLDALLVCLPPDAKVDLLRRIVGERRGAPGLVFTVSCDTASSLFEELSRTMRCALLTGRRCLVGAVRGEVDSVVRALGRREVELVIATDLGSTGLNLQEAGFVVHYDQPWSPAVVEQRNGRVCRIGQARSTVEAIALVPREGWSRRILNEKQRAHERFWNRDSQPGCVARAGREDWLAPSQIGAGSSPAVLSRRLRASGLATGEVIELLSTRHRAGVERYLDRIVREPLDGAALRALLAILRAEASMIPDRFPAI